MWYIKVDFREVIVHTLETLHGKRNKYKLKCSADESISRLTLNVDYLLNVYIIYQVKMSNVLWVQLLHCEDLVIHFGFLDDLPDSN